MNGNRIEWLKKAKVSSGQKGKKGILRFNVNLSIWKYCNSPKIKNRNGASEKPFTYKPREEQNTTHSFHNFVRGDNYAIQGE
ncbi:unnamed protein product, partial [Nesidiocoris tenuis]